MTASRFLLLLPGMRPVADHRAPNVAQTRPDAAMNKAFDRRASTVRFSNDSEHKTIIPSSYNLLIVPLFDRPLRAWPIPKANLMIINQQYPDPAPRDPAPPHCRACEIFACPADLEQLDINLPLTKLAWSCVCSHTCSVRASRRPRAQLPLRRVRRRAHDEGRHHPLRRDNACSIP